MPPIARSTQRHGIADSLKVLALLGVFMVNGLGYALAPHYPIQLGAPVPLDSALAQTVYALVLTLFMGKALPLLVFLFGHSMALNAMRSADPLRFKHRQWKLLLVGVLHGTLIYFGDILTAYALIGLLLAKHTAQRGRKLFGLWRFWAMASAALLTYWLWQTWIEYQPWVVIDPTQASNSFGYLSSYAEFASLNTSAYLPQQIGWLLTYAPLHICLFITGLLAARYRWLSDSPRLALVFFRTWLYRSWPIALVCNVALAIAALAQLDRYGLSANLYWVALVNVPLGMWLVASLLIRFMLHIQTKAAIPPWLLWLAPAGRHTLMMYLGLSGILMMSGRLGCFASESPANHTAVWFLALFVLWFAAVCAGRWATRNKLRDPISRWLSR